MPKVLIHLYTTLKEKLNAPKIWVEADNVEQALEALSQKNGAVAAILFDAGGIVKNHFTLALNSEVLDHKNLSKVPVAQGDVLHIFPPIAGG
ncbi:MAG: hypothetical protein A3G41_07920 [Elusimicrobia bacterium RIFCSPLOWO2_12_FULL_59_9]|nr:MAG: hypothetical protein A3G41_07920 [Elusimicrobia bacterium RIFCSPLOWO2_12_FULL_59_9]